MEMVKVHTIRQSTMKVEMPYCHHSPIGHANWIIIDTLDSSTAFVICPTEIIQTNKKNYSSQ